MHIKPAQHHRLQQILTYLGQRPTLGLWCDTYSSCVASPKPCASLIINGASQASESCSAILLPRSLRSLRERNAPHPPHLAHNGRSGHRTARGRPGTGCAGGLDAALGIPWGGASRCDAADPTCVTDGGTGEFATAQPVPPLQGNVTGVATLRVTVAGNDEGLLKIGLYANTPAASGTFAALAQGLYRADEGSSPAAWAYGADWRVERPFVRLSQDADKQDVAYRRRTGARKKSLDYAFSPSTPPKIDPEAAPSMLPAGALSVARSGPGPDLDFALSFAPSDGKDRYAIGALLDEASMTLLARLGSLPVVSSRAALGGKAGQPLVKVVVVDADFNIR